MCGEESIVLLFSLFPYLDQGTFEFFTNRATKETQFPIRGKREEGERATNVSLAVMRTTANLGFLGELGL
jgi:hypothetical protein